MGDSINVNTQQYQAKLKFKLKKLARCNKTTQHTYSYDRSQKCQFNA